MLKVGDRNRPASYLDGTGTTELLFGYEVVDGDEDTDGVSIEANSLSLKRRHDQGSLEKCRRAGP